MALPWIGILDTAIGMANMALAHRAKNRAEAEENRLAAGEASLAASGPLETHIAGVVVAALKEAFDRDSRRLDLERELAEAQRERAERALRLELLRQAGDREIGRLRLMAGVAVVIWLGTLLLSVRIIGGGVVARVVFGSGWICLLAALASAFVGLSRVNRALADADLRGHHALQPGPAGALAAGFVIAGLALVGVAVMVA